MIVHYGGGGGGGGGENSLNNTMEPPIYQSSFHWKVVSHF